MKLDSYLKLMADKEASDLFFSAEAPVNIKIQGHTQAVNKAAMTGDDIQALAYSILSEQQISEFEQMMELNLSYAIPEVGRYRVNIYRQRGNVAMVIRYIKNKIPTLEELNMPGILKSLVLEPRGLILVVGSTGSGKSTTLASMIDYRNTMQAGHILTIEDPIEFVHQHKKSVVDQREVGIDTLSYSNALRNAMREAPNVILIGEIRDRETMQHAIAYAETGHLCLSTLHANNANQAIDRIINFFPDSAHNQLLLDLSLNLRAVISQRLLVDIKGGRVPAVEILLRSPHIAELIEKREIELLKDAIEKNQDIGMQTFDQSLFTLFEEGKITEETALDNADSRNNLSLRIRLAKSGKGVEVSDSLTLGDK